MESPVQRKQKIWDLQISTVFQVSSKLKTWKRKYQKHMENVILCTFYISAYLHLHVCIHQYHSCRYEQVGFMLFISVKGLEIKLFLLKSQCSLLFIRCYLVACEEIVQAVKAGAAPWQWQVTVYFTFWYKRCPAEEAYANILFLGLYLFI